MGRLVLIPAMSRWGKKFEQSFLLFLGLWEGEQFLRQTGILYVSVVASNTEGMAEAKTF